MNVLQNLTIKKQKNKLIISSSVNEMDRGTLNIFSSLVDEQELFPKSDGSTSAMFLSCFYKVV